jgi:hypothetical protein
LTYIDPDAERVTLSIEEAVSYAKMITQKISFEAWKKTVEVLEFQN